MCHSKIKADMFLKLKSFFQICYEIGIFASLAEPGTPVKDALFQTYLVFQ